MTTARSMHSGGTHSSFRQHVPLNALAVQSGLVESLCRAAAHAEACRLLESQISDIQVSVSPDLHGTAAEVLMQATLALACLAYEDRSTAAVVASSTSSERCAAAVASLIMSGFARSWNPLSSSMHAAGAAAPATSAPHFTTHSSHLIGLLALLICHDPGLRSGGINHRCILTGDSATSALQLLTGAWPFLEGESRRWAALAVCALLPLAVTQVSSSSATDAASPTTLPSACGVSNVDVRTNTQFSLISPRITRLSDSSKSSHSPRLFISDSAESASSPTAQSTTTVDVVLPSQSSIGFSEASTQGMPSMPSNELGIMSALYSNQYARFHPLLTLALRLQVRSATLTAYYLCL
jgi:hypothetical protein